jgi:hypothetical protein
LRLPTQGFNPQTFFICNDVNLLYRKNCLGEAVRPERGIRASNINIYSDSLQIKGSRRLRFTKPKKLRGQTKIQFFLITGYTKRRTWTWWFITSGVFLMVLMDLHLCSWQFENKLNFCVRINTWKSKWIMYRVIQVLSLNRKNPLLIDLKLTFRNDCVSL